MLLALACAGCDAEAEPASPAPAAPVGPADFFPTRVGDRWRERVGDVSRTVAVTARTAEGLLVTFGTHDRRPAFYRVDEVGVTLVRPDGTPLEPLLRGPLRAGASFAYTSGEGPLAASCEATIRRSDATFALGPVTGCLALERICRHPEGGLFPSPTERRSDETWCPHLGRVRSEMELDPPLEGAPAPTMDVVHYVAAGAPLLSPRTFGCAQVLLLESDVAAACGPGWTWSGETDGEASCVTRFARGDDDVEVRVSRHEDAESAGRAQDVAAQPPGASRGAVEGRYALSVHASGGCRPEELGRLLPLLASMVRAP